MLDIKHLPNCLPDERFIYFLRKHPVTLTGIFLGYVAIFAMPFIAFSILSLTFPDVLSDPIIFPLIILAGSMFFLFCWLFLFQAFLDYYLDVWVVTNHRIINITQSGLFHRQVSELRLYRIQDATASLNGFLHTFLNFGQIEIQTAGEKARFVFEDIPHPQEVAKHILQLAEKDRTESISGAIEELDIQGDKQREQKDKR